MGSAVSLRTDFDGEKLRLLARQTKNANQACRLLALASIYDGGSRSDAARLGSVSLQIGEFSFVLAAAGLASGAFGSAPDRSEPAKP